MWDIDSLLKRQAGGSKTTETVKLCLSNQSAKKKPYLFTLFPDQSILGLAQTLKISALLLATCTVFF